MSNLLRLIMVLALLLVCLTNAYGQTAPQPPPIRNYQDYLIMMKAMNDFAKEHGMKPKKPLSEREWKKIYDRDLANESDKQDSDKKSEKVKLLNSNFGDFRKAK